MRILVVEDQEKLAQSIKIGLERQGYAVDYILDGETTLRRIELHNSDYDLIVLDLMLPKKDGFEVCKEIREQKINIPILVLTAKDDIENKIRALNLGADDYLVKPFSFEELVARVRALLRRPEPVLPSELKIEDLTLDPVTRRAWRGDKEVYLTLKEFALLEYLMRNSNRVLNREQIFDKVWDFASNAMSNVVDVHVKNLRKKIDDKHRKKLLETVRGVGYKIKSDQGQ